MSVFLRILVETRFQKHSEVACCLSVIYRNLRGIRAEMEIKRKENHELVTTVNGGYVCTIVMVQDLLQKKNAGHHR